MTSQRCPDRRRVSRVSPHDVPEAARGRLVQVGASVQLYAAHVFIADPNLHVRRFEGVFPGVHHEAKLALYRHLRHSTSSGAPTLATPSQCLQCIILRHMHKSPDGLRQSQEAPPSPNCHASFTENLEHLRLKGAPFPLLPLVDAPVNGPLASSTQRLSPPDIHQGPWCANRFRPSHNDNSNPLSLPIRISSIGYTNNSSPVPPLVAAPIRYSAYQPAGGDSTQAKRVLVIGATGGVRMEERWQWRPGGNH